MSYSPRTIPMPGPEEFCKKSLRDGNQCCLIGWANVAAGLSETKYYGNTGDGLCDMRRLKFRNKLLSAVLSAANVNLRDDASLEDEAWAWNDSGHVSTKQVADAWRRGAASLGYSEIYEAKR